MPIVEKHGGLWVEDSSDWRQQPVFEEHDARSDLLAVVVRSPSGHFVASLFEKVPSNQWRLPFWSERRPEALFGDELGAVAHVKALLQTASGV
jgi:hypothetical protein